MNNDHFEIIAHQSPDQTGSGNAPQVHEQTIIDESLTGYFVSTKRNQPREVQLVPDPQDLIRQYAGQLVPIDTGKFVWIIRRKETGLKAVEVAVEELPEELRAAVMERHRAFGDSNPSLRFTILAGKDVISYTKPNSKWKQFTPGI